MYFILSIKYSLSNTKQFPFQENNQVDKCNNTLPEVGNNWPPGNHFILTEQKYKCSRNSQALQLSQLTSHQEDAVTVTYGIILVSRRTRSFLQNPLPRLDGRIVDVRGELLELDGDPLEDSEFSSLHLVHISQVINPSIPSTGPAPGSLFPASIKLQDLWVVLKAF